MTADAPLTVRRATRRDLEAIQAMQHASLREHGANFYDSDVIEAYITHMGTMDAALIDDGTYYVAEIGGVIAGCGGWTTRRPAYHQTETIPWSSAPEVRSIYVNANLSRKGLGRVLMTHIERDIASRGHPRASLTATLGAIPFYRRLGYSGSEPRVVRLPGDRVLVGLMMSKGLAEPNGDFAKAA